MMGNSTALQSWTPTGAHPINGPDTIRTVPLTVGELLEISVAREAAVSPDGAHVAFCLITVEGDQEVPRLHLVAVDGIERELTATIEGRAPAWSPDGKSLAYLAGSGEGTELRLLSLADGSSALLAALAVLSRPVFSPRGDAIALVMACAKETTGSLVRVDRGGGTEELILDDEGEGREIHAPSFSPDGTALAFGLIRPGADGVGPTASIKVWGRKGGARTLATGCAFATCPSWSPDGTRLAFVGTAAPRIGLGDPGLRPWVVDAAGGVAEPAGPEGVVLEPAPVGPTWSAAGDALYLRLARAGTIDLVRLELAGGEPTALVAGRQVVDFSLAGEVVACSVIAPDDPGSVAVLSAAVPRRIEASVGEWTRRRAAAVPVPSHRTFHRADGRALDGWVAGVAPALAPQPTLLCFHGGPHGFFGPGFQRGHFYRDVLASRGWVVLTLNATGSGSYGAEFADELRGVWGERDLPEHLAALDRLVAEGIADPSRLAVAGYSYGGFLAARAIGRDSRFAAAVIGAPITDLESFEQTSDIGSWYTPWQMKCDLPENLDRYRWLSPVTHAAAVTTPALILHGEADRRVPFAQGELLRDRLAAAGNSEVELVGYPGADHLFYSSGGPAERVDFNRRVVDWLEAKVNGGGQRG
jgi:dipeptidyl aminopeptidase/acylaminoacyl peptidase